MCGCGGAGCHNCGAPSVRRRYGDRDHTQHRVHREQDRRAARRAGAAGEGSRRAAGRRRHGAVHRALPQGSDRDAGRRPAAHPRRAAAVPAGAGGAAHRRPRIRRRAGQADRRTARGDRGGRDQGAAGGHLPAVQAEAAHQGADRQGGGAGAAGGRPVGRPLGRTAVGCGRFRGPGEGRGRRPGRAGRRPGDPGRAVLRGRRPHRHPARADVGQGAAGGQGPRGPRRRGRSSPTTSTSPSRSPNSPRTGSSPCCAARRRAYST